MNILQYLSISLIVSLSIFIGAYIGKNVEEELKDGSKYIKTLFLVLSYVVFFLAAQLLFSNIVITAFLPTIIIFSTFYIPRQVRDYFFLTLLGISMGIVLNKETNYILPSIMFIQGLCIGTINYYLEKRLFNKKLFFLSGTFLFFSVISYVVYLFV